MNHHQQSRGRETRDPLDAKPRNLSDTLWYIESVFYCTYYVQASFWYWYDTMINRVRSSIDLPRFAVLHCGGQRSELY